MRYLGLDYGTKTLGIAVSDALGLIASSLKTINYPNEAYLLSELKKVIDEYGIKVVVLGLPKNMNNSLGESAIRTMKFGDLLKEKLSLEVIYEDERLTTSLATSYLLQADMSRGKRKGIVDKLSASIILQTYLDTQRKDK